MGRANTLIDKNNINIWMVKVWSKYDTHEFHVMSSP